jgi:hypothetical protein
MRATIVMVMLLAVAALCGCGGAGGDPAATGGGASGTTATADAEPPALGDRTLARRALIRRADFPDGWGQQRAPVTDLRCDGIDPFVGARVLVGSRRVVRDDIGIQETIAVFPTAAASRRGYARINSRAAMRCLHRDVPARVSAEAGGPARPLEAVRVDPLGDTGKAMRFTTTATSSFGVVNGYIDAVHLHAGRMLGALVIVSGLDVLEEGIYERAIRLFSRRLRATRS